MSLHFDKTVGPYNCPPASVKCDKEMEEFSRGGTAHLWNRDFQASIEAWLSKHSVEGITTLEELIQVNAQSPTAHNQTSGVHNWPYREGTLERIASRAEHQDHDDQKFTELKELSASQGLRKLWNDHPEVDVVLWYLQGAPLGSLEDSPMVRIVLILISGSATNHRAFSLMIRLSSRMA